MTRGRFPGMRLGRVLSILINWDEITSPFKIKLGKGIKTHSLSPSLHFV